MSVKEITSILGAWKLAEQSHAPAVLATVVRVEGSHYRRPGARMLVTPAATQVGSVSGGCLESDVLAHASEVIRTGKACVIHYDTTTESDLIFGSGMGCGGTVDILLEPAMSPGVRRLMRYFEKCVSERRSFAVGTVFAVSDEAGAGIGDKAILLDGKTDVIGIDDHLLRSEIETELLRTLDTRQGSVRRFVVPGGSVDVCFEYHRSPIALVIFGAGDDAIPVCRMAAQLGWQVTVVDHRAERLTKARFSEAIALATCRPQSVTDGLKLNDYDAAVVMTHNYEYDVELLKSLFSSHVRYIGLLGAAKRAGQILNEITRRGVRIDENMSNRLHAPVGLDLNAEGADEIALSIVAEIQMTLTGGTSRSLSFRRQSEDRESIHAKRNG